MRSSKFFKNEHNSQRNYQSSFRNFEFNAAELYPRRRRTEFYYQASVPEEYQSRSYEHPPILDTADPLWNEEHSQKKIIAPQSSPMRLARDSYFS